MQVRVVAVAEERLRCGSDDVGLEVLDDGDLVVVTDRRQNGADREGCERGSDVGSSCLGACTELPRTRLELTR